MTTPTPSDRPIDRIIGIRLKKRAVWSDIVAERLRQDEKHPGKTLDCADVSPFEKLCVLMEEVGELAHELTYDSDHDNEKVYAELTQVAALAVAWMESFQEGQ